MLKERKLNEDIEMRLEVRVEIDESSTEGYEIQEGLKHGHLDLGKARGVEMRKQA